MDYNARNEQGERAWHWKLRFGPQGVTYSNRDELHSHIQGNLALSLLHIPAADGLGRILLHGKGMPKGGHYHEVLEV